MITTLIKLQWNDNTKDKTNCEYDIAIDNLKKQMYTIIYINTFKNSNPAE